MNMTVNKKTLIGWLATIICTVAVLLGLKDSTLFSWPQTMFLAITLFYILITAMELLPNMIIAILLPLTYLFFQLAPAATVFSSWANNIVWICICAMLGANVLARIGLLKRIVFKCVDLIGYSYKKIIFAFAVIGLVLEIIAASGGYLIFAAIAAMFCTELNLKGTKTGAGLMLAMALSIGNGIIYSPASHGLLISMANTVGATLALDYVTFFLHNAPMLLFYFIPYALIPILFKQDAPIDANIIKAETSKLGAMSKEEKIAAVITVIFIIGLLTTNIHNVNMLYLFVLFAVAFYIPGIGIGLEDDIRKVNYSLIFFITSFITIGSVATTLNFNQVVSALLTPMLSGTSSNIVIYSLIYVFAFIVNFVMTPLAAMAAFTTPITQVAIDLGLGVYPALYAFYGGLCESLLPYEIAKFLVVYAYGMFTFKDFAKLFGARAILHLVFLALIMVPFWGFIGLA
mgnify:CR=1 FL=1